MAKILSKFGEQQLVMVNYACGLNQSETGKYFECIIILDIFSVLPGVLPKGFGGAVQPDP